MIKIKYGKDTVDQQFSIEAPLVNIRTWGAGFFGIDDPKNTIGVFFDGKQYNEGMSIKQLITKNQDRLVVELREVDFAKQQPAYVAHDKNIAGADIKPQETTMTARAGMDAESEEDVEEDDTPAQTTAKATGKSQIKDSAKVKSTAKQFKRKK